MATVVKIDIKNDLGVTLADFNKEAHLGTFEVPVWAQDLYAGKTDEEIFNDFAGAIYESFTPIIGEALAFIYTANLPYFESDKIRGNVRLAMFQEISNWMLNVPMEVKNNVNFSAQAGFSFSLSIQPWLINYDEFNIKTRTFIQETGLIGVCIEDLAGIELWVKPTFHSGEELRLVSINQDKQYTGKDAELTQKGYVDETVRLSVVGSHKSIAGEFEVASATEAQTFLDTYAAGLDQILTNGRVFNNGNASPGEVIYLVPVAGSSIRAEEIIVGANKDLITLSNENIIDASLADHETRITDAEAKLTQVDTSTQVDDKIAIEKTERENDVQSINQSASDLEDRVIDNEDDIDSLQSTSQIHDEKLREIENAGLLEDKIWIAEAGHELQAADGLDISTIVDQNGNTFDFAAGKRIELIFAKELYEASQDVTVDGSRAINFAIPLTTNPTGNYIQFQVKLTSAGTLDIKSADGSDLSKVFLIEVREVQAAMAINSAYTKTESDGKYATIVNLAAVKTTADTAQQATDARLTTTSKQVWGAINELDGERKQNESLLANIGSLKTSDGDDLSTTTEELVTGKTLTATVYTKAEVDAAIAAAVATALNEIMDVTFDDASTGTFKIGK